MAPQPLIEDILAQMDTLPEVPAVALQVNRMLDDPDMDAQGLAKIITMDPSLTGKILKLCNSAEYGFSRKIGTISEAVSVLGYKELKRIVLAIISHGFLNRPVEGYALEKGALWDNALTCAAYARHIAQRVKYSNPELAFIAALLRDIGKIAMESYIRGQGRSLEETVRSQKMAYHHAEESVIGASHTEVGRQLGLKWNLPDALVNSIAFHHHPSDLPGTANADDKKLVAVVHLADTFTMMTGKGVGVDGLMYPLDTGVFALLGLKQDANTLDNLFAELLMMQDEINQLATSFEGGR